MLTRHETTICQSQKKYVYVVSAGWAWISSPMTDKPCVGQILLQSSHSDSLSHVEAD